MIIPDLPAVSGPGAVSPRGEWGQWWQYSPCAYLVLDAEADLVVEANDTFTSWSGLGREEVIGATFTRLLPVGDRIVWSTHALPKLTADGRVSEVSVQVIGANKSRHAAFLSAIRLPREGGPAAVTGTDGTDGTDRAGAGDDSCVLIVLFAAGERRRYEEELLAAKRRAEASEARRAAAEQHLQHLVHHDPVTGLLNRSGLHAALSTALAATAATAETAPAGSLPAPALPVVLFIDLDGFKAVNDSVGHAGGDELLTILGQRLSAAARQDTVIARFAGDEFVVLDHLRDEDEAVGLCQRLLAELAAPVMIHGVEVVVSASAGIAFAEQPAGTPEGDYRQAAETMLLRADAAMYQVKSNGRSGWAVHDPDAADVTADRLRLLQELRQALSGDQLRLYYQPRVRLGSAETTGVEALIRWQHPTRGLLAPAAFIDVAEASGLIRDVGAWVIETAVAQAAAWNAGGTPVQMSINISTRQLNDPALVTVITTALARHGVKASQLVLEITETALMLDPQTAQATLSALAELGAQVAIDDFGTGYASLTYLQRFPVHELKIDRSFVAAMVNSPADRAIVATCIQLARALGLVSVAEGVETAEQQQALLEEGCDLAQGYLFARPRPASSTP